MLSSKYSTDNLTMKKQNSLAMGFCLTKKLKTGQERNRRNVKEQILLISGIPAPAVQHGNGDCPDYFILINLSNQIQ